MAVTFDARSKREELAIQKAMAEKEREAAMQSIKNIREILDRLDMDVVDSFFDKGVDIKTFLSYDLDKLYTDAEYQRAFINEGNKVLSELEGFIRRESGVM